MRFRDYPQPINFMRCKSFECWLCKRLWPYEDEYEWCPACEEQCTGSAKDAMGPADAIKLATEYSFGWWLWKTNSL